MNPLQGGSLEHTLMRNPTNLRGPVGIMADCRSRPASRTRPQTTLGHSEIPSPMASADDPASESECYWDDSCSRMETWLAKDLAPGAALGL